MAELLIKLIEKLIELFREKERIDKSFHDNFIIPIIQQYEAVHNQYVTSFLCYQNIIQNQQIMFNEDNIVFKQINNDIIISFTVREKFFQMTKSLMCSRKINSMRDNSLIRKLLIPIHSYILQVAGWENAIEIEGRNYERFSLINELRVIACRYSSLEDYQLKNGLYGSQELAMMAISNRISEMQNVNSRIQSAYQDVKIELLM